MTYRPEECVFPPHWKARIPSLIYLLIAICVGGVVVIGENSPTNSTLFNYVVNQDINRVMSMRMLAIILAVGSVASVLRSGMRGVRVYSEGVESREIHRLFLPKVRRYRWMQLERIILDMKSTVALDLWDGSRAFLPPVAEHEKLVATLEHVGAARAIPVRGGVGLDDIPEPQRASLEP